MSKGGVTVKVTMDPSLAGRMTGACARAREMMAAEVLRGSSPLVPVKTGRLRGSGEAGADGVTWTAPYARAQYERHREKARWFERWKAANGAALVAKVKKEVGGAI